MDAFELRRSLKQRECRKNKTFEELVEKCCRCIRRTAESKGGHYEFHVPRFVFGAALYDLQSCTEYMCTRLKTMGYRVNASGSVLFVSWSADAPAQPPAAQRSPLHAPLQEPPQKQGQMVLYDSAQPATPVRHSFPPPGQWLSSKLLDAHREKLPFKPDVPMDANHALVSHKRKGGLKIDFS